MRGSETRHCEICGSAFRSRKSRSKRTCSRPCSDRLRAVASSRTQSRKVALVCKQCGRRKLVSPVYASRRFCSPRCGYDFNSGPRNPNWRGGITPEQAASLPSNGSAFAHVSGQETDELASGAEKFTNALQKSLRHITSEAGEGSQGFARAWQTLCCCAVIAMSSFIPEGIRKSNSFDISFEIVTGYTSIPYRGKPAADGPRYKAIGNSMARPVMEWLGERIDAAEAATA